MKSLRYCVAMLCLLIGVWARAAAADDAPSEYHLRHIVLASEAEARVAIGRLKAGKASFAELAKASLDTANAGEGGELGWLDPRYLPPSLGAATLAQGKPGLIVEPLQTPLGWHVLEVVAVRAQIASTRCDFDCTVQRHLAAIDQRDWRAYEATLTRDDTLSLVLPNGKLSTEALAFRRQMQDWLADKDWQWQHTLLHKRQGKGWGMAILKVAYQDKDEQGKIYRLEYLLQLLFEQQREEWRLVHDQNTLLKAP